MGFSCGNRELVEAVGDIVPEKMGMEEHVVRQRKARRQALVKDAPLRKIGRRDWEVLEKQGGTKQGKEQWEDPAVGQTDGSRPSRWQAGQTELLADSLSPASH